MIRFLTSLKGTLFRLGTQARTAHALYTGAVAQARQPFFYGPGAMSDTPETRLESVMLHLALLSERLSGPEFQVLHRVLLETFVRDMDRTVRQMGFGDTGVAKRVKHLAGMLHHRLAHYHAAWKDNSASEESYTQCPGIALLLSRYVPQMRMHLAKVADETLRAGTLSWPERDQSRISS